VWPQIVFKRHTAGAAWRKTPCWQHVAFLIEKQVEHFSLCSSNESRLNLLSQEMLSLFLAIAANVQGFLLC